MLLQQLEDSNFSSLEQPGPSQLPQALGRRNISKAINQTQAQEGEGSSSKPRWGRGQATVGPAEHQSPAGTANVTAGHSHELPLGREGWLWSSFCSGNALGVGGGCCRTGARGRLEPSAKTSCIPPEHRTAVRGKTNSPHIPLSCTAGNWTLWQVSSMKGKMLRAGSGIPARACSLPETASLWGGRDRFYFVRVFRSGHQRQLLSI